LITVNGISRNPIDDLANEADIRFPTCDILGSVDDLLYSPLFSNLKIMFLKLFNEVKYKADPIDVLKNDGNVPFHKYKKNYKKKNSLSNCCFKWFIFNYFTVDETFILKKKRFT